MQEQISLYARMYKIIFAWKQKSLKISGFPLVFPDSHPGAQDVKMSTVSRPIAKSGDDSNWTQILLEEKSCIGDDILASQQSEWLGIIPFLIQK